MNLPSWQEDVGWDGLGLGKRPPCETHSLVEMEYLGSYTYRCQKCGVVAAPDWESQRPAVPPTPDSQPRATEVNT